ncbi:MAG: Flp pilus assembly complex ATPase component TadA, partial [Desulfobacterales bacterium]|nr:Flp pilus assembly complex ATPase component TadA [Desulfobacterales bacterium]
MEKQEVDHILTRLLDSHKDVSDINLTVGKPMQVESSGQLIGVDMKPYFKELTPYQTETIALTLVDHDRRLTENLIKQGSCDLSYSLPGKARFRVNIFSQSGNYSIVLRKLESKVPTVDEMQLPEAFHDVAKEVNGIVVVTGATGTGKSTSIATVLDSINENRSV